MAELDALISSRSVRVRSLIIEGSHLDPRVMQRFQARERVLLRKLQRPPIILSVPTILHDPIASMPPIPTSPHLTPPHLQHRASPHLTLCHPT